MRDWRVSFWLVVASIYALYNGFDWKHWQDLAIWTRLHASVEICTGLSMLLGAVALFVVRSPLRALIRTIALAPAVLGISLILGTWAGTIPCTGGG